MTGPGGYRGTPDEISHWFLWCKPQWTTIFEKALRIEERLNNSAHHSKPSLTIHDCFSQSHQLLQKLLPNPAFLLQVFLTTTSKFNSWTFNSVRSFRKYDRSPTLLQNAVCFHTRPWQTPSAPAEPLTNPVHSYMTIHDHSSRKFHQSIPLMLLSHLVHSHRYCCLILSTPAYTLAVSNPVSSTPTNHSTNHSHFCKHHWPIPPVHTGSLTNPFHSFWSFDQSLLMQRIWPVLHAMQKGLQIMPATTEPLINPTSFCRTFDQSRLLLTYLTNTLWSYRFSWPITPAPPETLTNPTSSCRTFK